MLLHVCSSPCSCSCFPLHQLASALNRRGDCPRLQGDAKASWRSGEWCLCVLHLGGSFGVVSSARPYVLQKYNTACFCSSSKSGGLAHKHSSNHRQ